LSFRKHETSLVHPDADIGEGTRVWAFVNIQAGAKIGRDCNICDGCYIEGGSVIGDRVTVKNNVCVFEGVTLEDDVFVGANIAFINDRYPRAKKYSQWTLEKTVVKKGAALGTNSTVMCGITVGEFALVAAGSVVTRDVAPYTLVAGNPAKPRGRVNEQGLRVDE
jgi:acetyltransferase-like isoleucine patch superfamily enzyme